MKVRIQVDYDQKESSLLTEDQLIVIRKFLDDGIQKAGDYALRCVRFMSKRKKYGLQSYKKS